MKFIAFLLKSKGFIMKYGAIIIILIEGLNLIFDKVEKHLSEKKSPMMESNKIVVVEADNNLSKSAPTLLGAGGITLLEVVPNVTQMDIVMQAVIALVTIFTQLKLVFKRKKPTV